MAEFPDLEFMKTLQTSLNGSERFRQCTLWWDGGVLLKVGPRSAWMKWYRGQVIDVHGGPSLFGFTFALNGSAEAWRELVEMPLTSYRSWARILASGAIGPEGNIFEYRRMTEAVYTLCYQVRQLSRGEHEPGER